MTQRLDPSPLKNRDQPWAGMILRASAVLYQRETVFGLSWSEFVMICLKICHLSLNWSRFLNVAFKSRSVPYCSHQNS